MLSEIESEVPGEERVLELPVEPDWIGRRLEITVRYEARGGASEESEPQSLDVTGPLPLVEGVLVRGRAARADHLGGKDPPRRSWERRRWREPAVRSLPEARRGIRAAGTVRSARAQTDADVVWGEEVCYRARLVAAGKCGGERDPRPRARTAPAGRRGSRPKSAGADPDSGPGRIGETPAPDETGRGGRR